VRSAKVAQSSAAASTPRVEEETMDKQTVIDVRDLVVEYGSNGRGNRAVDGVSFSVEAGQCVGFIGPNGAGKSSTMKAIMGFIFPKTGQISVFGKPAGTVESKLRIGYLPEVTLYYPFLKAKELLRLYGGLHRVPRSALKDRIPTLMAAVGLDGAGDKLIKNYSKGMQQRLGIAQALIAEPECLIFDELSSGLDPVGRHDLRQVLMDLKKDGTTIFFSSHELYEVEALCDRVIAIHKGRVLFDYTLSEFREKAGNAGLEEYFMCLVRERESSS
jgi:ABC-2 type transport system ATP-binding protein